VRENRGAFAGWPMIIGWAAMLIFAFHACTHMVAAGDTWVAMACGRHFVNHGVDTVEPFSANSHKAGPTAEEVKTWPKWAQTITNIVGLETVRYWHPTGWVNQNWLTHVIFYKLTTMLGSEQNPYFDALILWKFAIYILAAVCLYFTTRIYGVNRAIAVVFVCFSLFIGRSFFDVRPAGFSNLLVAVYMLVLALTVYRNKLYIWLLVPLVVFWCNVHGGYIYAFIMLVPFVVWHAIMNLPRRWMIAAYSILMWLALYGMANRLLHHEYLTPVALWQDWAFYLVGIAVAGSILLTWTRHGSDQGLAAFHVTVSCVLFLLLLIKFFPGVSYTLGGREQEVLSGYLATSRLSYVGVFAFAMVLGAIVVSLREKMVRTMTPRAILHTIGAGAAAFVAMVIFNPFHLTNLTHTFEISVSKHAERWRDVHEWHRALDWTNPVGTAIPFLVLYILGWLCLVIWVSASIYAVWVTRRSTNTKKKKAAVAEDPWQKTDVALLAIAALTIYLAIRSRRFIPIAAFAACPVLALVIHETVGRLITVIGFRRQAKMDPPVCARSVAEATMLGVTAAMAIFGLWCLLLQRWLFLPVPLDPQDSELIQPQIPLLFMGIVLTILAFLFSVWWYATASRPATPANAAPTRAPLVQSAVLIASLLLCGSVVVLGASVGWRFKRVYLDPWPGDPVLSSVFMRMTASDAKPFDTSQFICQNKLRGKMFNYWTEGGFIAWGQDPDPNTGRTPLQLFMDGRAQAAYSVQTFDLWTNIMSGGPTVKRAFMSGQKLDTADYVEVGKWISEQLRKQNVWIVLMPASQFSRRKDAFTPGLEHTTDWRIVFISDKQKLLVDVATPAGKELYEGMFSGKTAYPDEYSKDMAVGHNLLLFADVAQKKKGLELIIKALTENPTPAPVVDMLLIALRTPELYARVDQACTEYVMDFEANRKTYARQDGYNVRLEAARLAMIRLEQAARIQGNNELAQKYYNDCRSYERERDAIAASKRW
jgi:hypothetical protein